MKPVVILRFSPTEEPGFLKQYLDARRMPWKLVCIDQGEAVPASISGISALALMGGPMSVNDEMPWIGQTLQLIQLALDANVPVLGHCLGGQFLAKALGAKISDNESPEIGWGDVEVLDPVVAREWFGGATHFDTFHWHYQTFDIPQGAIRIMRNDACENQAFIYNARHIGFQCHMEMTADLVRRWSSHGADQLLAAKSEPFVQSAETMLHDLPLRIASLNALTSQVYERWLASIVYVANDAVTTPNGVIP